MPTACSRATDPRTHDDVEGAAEGEVGVVGLVRLLLQLLQDGVPPLHDGDGACRQKKSPGGAAAVVLTPSQPLVML